MESNTAAVFGEHTIFPEYLLTWKCCAVLFEDKVKSTLHTAFIYFLNKLYTERERSHIGYLHCPLRLSLRG